MKTLQTNLVTLPLKKLIFLLILNGNSSFPLVKMVIGQWPWTLWRVRHVLFSTLYTVVHYATGGQCTQ